MAKNDRKSKGWAVVRVSAGSILDMYDFMVFGQNVAAIGDRHQRQVATFQSPY